MPCDKINGKGEYIYSNGDKYIGEFKDNVFHGHGCYINANGDTYEGEYRYGLKKVILSFKYFSIFSNNSLSSILFKSILFMYFSSI